MAVTLLAYAAFIIAWVLVFALWRAGEFSVRISAIVATATLAAAFAFCAAFGFTL